MTTSAQPAPLTASPAPVKAAIPTGRPTKPDFRAGLVMVAATAVGTGTVHDLLGTTLLTSCALGLVLLLGHLRLAARLGGAYLGLRLLHHAASLGAGLPLVPWCGVALTITVLSYPTLVVGVLVLSRVPMGEMMASLARLRLPGMLLVVLVVIYRYVPALLVELATVRSAARLRGSEPGWRRWLRHPLAELEHAVVPVIMRSGRIADELSAVAECKGLSPAHPRSAMVEPRLGAPDWLLVGGVVAVVVVLNLWERA